MVEASDNISNSEGQQADDGAISSADDKHRAWERASHLIDLGIFVTDLVVARRDLESPAIIADLSEWKDLHALDRERLISAARLSADRAPGSCAAAGAALAVLSCMGKDAGAAQGVVMGRARHYARLSIADDGEPVWMFEVLLQFAAAFARHARRHNGLDYALELRSDDDDNGQPHDSREWAACAHKLRGGSND